MNHRSSRGNYLRKAVCLLLVLVSGGPLTPGAVAAESEAAEAGQSAVNNPYYITLLQIGLRKEQVPEFKSLIGSYAGDRQAAIEKALRGRQGNLESRVRRAKAKVSDDFSASMRKLLDGDQFSRFPPFHEELDKMLLERESLEQDNDAQSVFPSRG